MRSFYSPLSISAPFYGYLKLLATRKGKKSKQGCEIRESNSGPLAPRPRTNRLCHPCSFLMGTLEPRNDQLPKLEMSTNFEFELHMGSKSGSPHPPPPPPTPFHFSFGQGCFFFSFVNVCRMVLRAFLLKYIVFTKHC